MGMAHLPNRWEPQNAFSVTSGGISRYNWGEQVPQITGRHDLKDCVKVKNSTLSWTWKELREQKGNIVLGAHIIACAFMLCFIVCLLYSFKNIIIDYSTHLNNNSQQFISVSIVFIILMVIS